jgi:hypothetical protein
MSGVGGQASADGEFACPLSHEVRDHPEDADGCQERCYGRKQSDDLRAKSWIRQRVVK